MNHSKSIEQFAQNCAAMGIQLQEKQLDQFVEYYHMLVEKNKVMNLTGITDFDEVLVKHFLDSLSIVINKQFNQNINCNNSIELLDVGTGAGFPGIPLKIAFPEIRIVLLDSLQKRINFLQEVIKSLHLNEISAIHGRAEDFARNNKVQRERYDFVVSRAVANLSSLCEYCIPFVKVGGSFLSYKSSSAKEEVEKAGRAIALTGGKLKSVDEFILPGSDIYRSIVNIEKIKATPLLYPRKAGTPGKKPL